MAKTIVQERNEFDLPTELTEPEVNMGSCLLYGLEKCGKTTALTKLPNCLIIDTEKGTKKVSALVKEVPQDLGPVSKLQWLEKLADYLIEKGRPYDYVAIDTLTKVDEWSEWSGTYRYMNSTQGKSFNRVLDNRGNPIKGGEMLTPDDENYESVHTIGEGYGYRWSREDMLRLIEKYMNVAKKCIFFICHVEDKYIGGGDTRIQLKEMVVPTQLALTGKLKKILPRRVDGIGYVSNDKGVIKVNFTGSEERVGGNRCTHLQGYNGPLDWDKIFI